MSALKLIPFSTVYCFDKLYILSRWIINYLDKYVPLNKVNFTRPLAPCMKERDNTELQEKRND